MQRIDLKLNPLLLSQCCESAFWHWVGTDPLAKVKKSERLICGCGKTIKLQGDTMRWSSNPKPA